jgi:hypothetical protein
MEAKSARIDFDAGHLLELDQVADADALQLHSGHHVDQPNEGWCVPPVMRRGNSGSALPCPAPRQGAYGSVTSAVATLTVTNASVPPQIVAGGVGFGFLTNQFGFNVSGAAGQMMVVDGSTNLVSWIPLFTNTGGGSPFYFFDAAWTNFPWRF